MPNEEHKLDLENFKKRYAYKQFDAAKSSDFLVVLR